MNILLGIWHYFFPSLTSSHEEISAEKMEEYRMLSFFEVDEIQKLSDFFFEQTKGLQEMNKECFFSIGCIELNPFRDKLALIFGYDGLKNSISFEEFLLAASLFNCPGRKDLKIRTAYRLQDIDNDGVLSRDDIRRYIQIITDQHLNDSEIGNIVSRVMHECSSDPNLDFISLQDFQRVVTKSDFETKLRLHFY
jgi:Ca2+-binding EF-hand superfamily protein